MSGIGPGDGVIALKEIKPRCNPPISITKGAIYVVEKIVTLDNDDRCPDPNCTVGKVSQGIVIKNQPEDVIFMGLPYKFCFCPCAFAPWPGPADEMLKDVDIDLDDDVKAPELEKV